MTSSGITTPTTVLRQARIQIPSTLPSLLQTELLLLDRLLRKNKPQHRTGLFYQKCTHVLRLMKRMAVVMTEVVKANESVVIPPAGAAAAGSKGTPKQDVERDIRRFHGTLVELVDKTLPAITKAFDVLEKMINHLHFLPLTTTLLAITSRMFVITVDVAFYLVQYRDATQSRNPISNSGSSTPITGNAKERDKASFSFEDVVDMVINGKMKNSRITTAQEQLEQRLKAMDDQVQQNDKGKGKAVGTAGEQRLALLEMDGEDFGEAIEAPTRRPESITRVAAIGVKTPRAKTPIVLDPPSSPDEPKPSRSQVAASSSTSISGVEQTLEEKKAISAERKVATDVFATSFSCVTPELPEAVTALPTMETPKLKKRPITEESSRTKIATKRKSSTVSSGAGEKPKVKKKKGKDPMDDIFGL